MASIVFILGAGASASSGAPLLDGFLEKASQLLKLKQVESKREHFNRVFDAISKLQIVHSKSQLDLNNIESVFTTLEMSKIINRFPNAKPDAIETILSSLKELIVTTLETSIEFPVEKKAIRPTEAYMSFIELCSWLMDEARPKQTVSIITFNYDILIDFALNSLGYRPIYGFEEIEKNPRNIPLLKLHGSLNWASSSENDSIIPLYLFDYLRSYHYPGFDEFSKCKLPIGSQLFEYFSEKKIPINQQPVIVPPSWNKFTFYNSLNKVWESAAKELSEAEYIYIIGYSLPETDTFFKLLFGLGTVGDKLLKRILVINPDKTGLIKSRFEKIFGSAALSKYDYVMDKFENCSKTIRELHT